MNVFVSFVEREDSTGQRDWPTKRARQIRGGGETRGINGKKRKYIQKCKNREGELKYMNVK